MRQGTDGPDKDAWKKKRDAQKAFYKDPSVSVGGDNQTKIQKAFDDNHESRYGSAYKTTEVGWICKDEECGWQGNNPSSIDEYGIGIGVCPLCDGEASFGVLKSATPDWLRSLTACSIWIGSWYGAWQYCIGGNHEPGEGPSAEAIIGVGILLVFILPGFAVWWYNEYK